MVTLSAGTYLLDKGLKLPNYTRLVGQGQDISTIKLSTKAPRETIALTNLKMSGEARCISIEDLAVNGNKKKDFQGKLPLAQEHLMIMKHQVVGVYQVILDMRELRKLLLKC